MNDFNSAGEQSGEMAFDSMDRISEIESELLNDGNRSVVIVILFAFVLVLLFSGFVTYTMTGESQAGSTRSPILEDISTHPKGH